MSTITQPAVGLRGTKAVIAGAVGGVYGAAAMTLLRLAMHRAGVIDKMVPQVVEEWISDRLHADPPGREMGHHTLDQLLHLAYGAGWGAMAGPFLTTGHTRGGVWRAGVFGLTLWGVGMLALLPALRVARPAWKASVLENATNVAAHLAYGFAVQLLVEEPARQRAHRRTSDAERQASRVG
jgi:hypothetical protein